MIKSKVVIKNEKNGSIYIFYDKYKNIDDYLKDMVYFVSHFKDFNVSMYNYNYLK